MSILAVPPRDQLPCCQLPLSGPRAPATARRAAVAWLRPLPLGPEAVDAIVLIVSELVTNAVRHTRGPCVLTLTASGPGLDIACRDDSEDLPEPWHIAGDERGGFGLHLVREVGGDFRVVPGLGGKTVHVLYECGRDSRTSGPRMPEGSVTDTGTARGSGPADGDQSADGQAPNTRHEDLR